MAFALPRHRIVLAACLLAAGAHPCTALAADNRRFDASLEAYRAGVYRNSGKDSLCLLAQMHGRAVPVLREALADTRSESSPGGRNAAQLALAEALIGSDEVEAGMHALDQADAGVAQARETGSQGLQLLTRVIGLNRLGRHAGGWPSWHGRKASSSATATCATPC